MRRIRVLFGTNYQGNDTTSWLRAFGPLSMMSDIVEIVEPKLTYRKSTNAETLDQYEGLNLDLQAGWWWDWKNWVDIDVCFLHRPFGVIGGAIATCAKMHDVPLWVDHDDDLLAIPNENPHKEIHAKGEKLFPGVELSYKEADVLTCSGKAMLKELHEKYNRKDAILITTGLDDRLVRFKKPFTKNNKISWRGSTSHVSDIAHFKPQLLNIAKKYPDLFWFWAGIDIRMIFGNTSPFEGEFSPQRNMIPFLTELCNMNSSIHIVPLEDNHFNRVKSNLAWLDATLAGSAVVGPCFEEWVDIHTMAYTGPSDFELAVERAIKLNETNELHDFHDWSWEYIKQNLMTSKLNLQRREILERFRK